MRRTEPDDNEKLSSGRRAIVMKTNTSVAFTFYVYFLYLLFNFTFDAFHFLITEID
jgi:hypothetical protein